nr:snake venom metalloproteinases P-III precursor [Rhamphiophis oxyrhynchus]
MIRLFHIIDSRMVSEAIFCRAGRVSAFKVFEPCCTPGSPECTGAPESFISNPFSVILEATSFTMQLYSHLDFFLLFLVAVNIKRVSVELCRHTWLILAFVVIVGRGFELFRAHDRVKNPGAFCPDHRASLSSVWRRLVGRNLSLLPSQPELSIHL